MKTFWFDGESAAAHGLVISGSGTFNAAERDVEMVSIPGRNGDMVIDNGRYKNIPVNYPASICQNFAVNAEKARAWLGSKIGYCRLEDDYDPDHFRLGRFQGPLQFTTGFLNRTGECTVSFDCKPQRFLKSGERAVAVTDGTELLNFTNFPAVPLIEVTVTPEAYEDTTLISANLDIIDAQGETSGITLHYKGLNDTTTIFFDAESREIYSFTADGVKQNRDSIASFHYDTPVIQPGLNKISVVVVNGSVDAIRIVPRWWTL